MAHYLRLTTTQFVYYSLASMQWPAPSEVPAIPDNFYGNRSCKIFSIQKSNNFSSWKGGVSFPRNVGTHKHSKLHEVSSPEYSGVYIYHGGNLKITIWLSCKIKLQSHWIFINFRAGANRSSCPRPKIVNRVSFVTQKVPAPTQHPSKSPQIYGVMYTKQRGLW